MSAAALRALAREVGIQTSYKATSGQRPRASDDALVAVLAALGLPVTTTSDAGNALEGWRRRSRSRLVEPVVTAWRGRFGSPPTIAAPAGRAVRVRLLLDDGTERKVTADAVDRPGGPATHVLELSGGPLPAGYHELEVSSGSRRDTCLVVSAPRRAYTSERVHRGVVAPVPALHHSGRGTDGTYTDLGDLGAWVARRGGNTVGTLPVLAREPGEDSPYSPSTKLLWDERLIDPDAGPEWGNHQDLDTFLAAHPLVAAYARFRSAVDRHGPDWRCWPAGVAEAVRSGALDDTSRLHAGLQHRTGQQIDALITRLAADTVSLYLDLPVGVSPTGFDCFDRPELFAVGVSVGAPPDALFAGGQVWGFPPLSPVASRAEGHAYFREGLAHHMAAADLLRIDHVMGLHRQFWVPGGMAATAGVYVRQPADELWAIACLESHRHSCELIGENLGTVPEEVNDALRRHRARGMWVMPFATTGEPDQALQPVPPGDAATLGTHDTPTFAGFWAGRDIDDMVELDLLDRSTATTRRKDREAHRSALTSHLATAGLLDPGPDPDQATTGDLLAGMLRWLHASVAGATIIPLEDLWLETEPQNVPGTDAAQRPNWRRRMRHPVDHLDEVEVVGGRLELLTTPIAMPTGGPSPMATHNSTRTQPRKPASGEADAITGIGPDDVHLFNEGTHSRLYQKLGAHPTSVDGEDGTAFAVWAPNAEAVSVKGEFCDWDDDAHPLETLGSSGIWRGFVPDVGPGDLYKFHIRSRHEGYRVDKADPFAFATEMPPETASRVADLSYEWGDGEWMKQRARTNALDAPMSVYEVHLGSWRRVLDEGNRSIHYTEAATQLADHVAELGFTHVELVPIMEHPFFGSWGYQTTSYFAPSARYGSPTELMAMIDALHQRGVGVILDWVPSHFPTDEHGLAYFDGTHLFEHDDPKQGYHPDWNSYIFNYGRHEVRSFLISSALFWLDRYHLDGLRVDAVASMLYLDYSRAEGEWVPNRHGGREDLDAIDFLRALNETVYGAYPDVQTIAEESTAWPMVSRPTYVGGLGFGLKWDMGWMHDTLEYFRRDPIHRRHHHHELTFRMVYAYNENFVLPLSHDEVVHGKGSLLGRMPGDDWQRFANLRALYGYMYGQPGKKLLFMGAELAQPGEWNHDGTLDWHLLDEPRHRGVFEWLGHLNRLHAHEPALHEQDVDGNGFQWVEANDAQHSVMAFLRLAADGSPILVVANLTPEPQGSYRLGVPVPGEWREIANSDAEEYGGSGLGNLGTVSTRPFPSHGHEQSLVLTLPPLAVLFLKPA